MSRAAKATLITAVVLTTFTIWGVHYLQWQEHEVRTSTFYELMNHRTKWVAFAWNRLCTRASYAMMREGGKRCCREQKSWRNLRGNANCMNACSTSTEIVATNHDLLTHRLITGTKRWAYLNLAIIPPSEVHRRYSAQLFWLWIISRHLIWAISRFIILSDGFHQLQDHVPSLSYEEKCALDWWSVMSIFSSRSELFLQSL